MGSRREAVVVIDGNELTDEQAGSLRVAMACFIRDLELAARRHGASGNGTQATLTRCKQVHRLLDDARVSA